jgi:hypothetical protein
MAAIMSPPFSGTGYPERPSPNLVRIRLGDRPSTLAQQPSPNSRRDPAAPCLDLR